MQSEASTETAVSAEPETPTEAAASTEAAAPTQAAASTEAAAPTEAAALAGTDAPAPDAERRTDGRQGYACTQLMAPYDGERLPKQGEFGAVQCRDISESGFSFYTATPPDQPSVVIALGEVPFMFFAARVSRVDASDDPTYSGYVVACDFDKRLT